MYRVRASVFLSRGTLSMGQRITFAGDFYLPRALRTSPEFEVLSIGTGRVILSDGIADLFVGQIFYSNSFSSPCVLPPPPPLYLSIDLTCNAQKSKKVVDTRKVNLEREDEIF